MLLPIIISNIKRIIRIINNATPVILLLFLLSNFISETLKVIYLINTFFRYEFIYTLSHDYYCKHSVRQAAAYEAARISINGDGPSDAAIATVPIPHDKPHQNPFALFKLAGMYIPFSES